MNARRCSCHWYSPKHYLEMTVAPVTSAWDWTPGAATASPPSVPSPPHPRRSGQPPRPNQSYLRTQPAPRQPPNQHPTRPRAHPRGRYSGHTPGCRKSSQEQPSERARYRGHVRRRMADGPPEQAKRNPSQWTPQRPAAAPPSAHRTFYSTLNRSNHIQQARSAGADPAMSWQTKQLAPLRRDCECLNLRRPPAAGGTPQRNGDPHHRTAETDHLLGPL